MHCFGTVHTQDVTASGRHRKPSHTNEDVGSGGDKPAFDRHSSTAIDRLSTKGNKFSSLSVGPADHKVMSSSDSRAAKFPTPPVSPSLSFSAGTQLSGAKRFGLLGTSNGRQIAKN